MKRSPIVTTRDARLSLWTSLAESLMKKKNPGLSTQEIRNLPMMRGVFAHVQETQGKTAETLNAEAKTQQKYSTQMYSLVSSSELSVIEHLVEGAIDILEGKDVAALESEYAAALDAMGIRYYSNDDLGNWILMSLEWLVVVNAYEYTKLPWYKKALKALKDLTDPIADLVGKWLLQSSDTEIQQNLIEYKDWSNLSDSVIQWKLPNDARVVMLGDWGTSLDDAKQLLKAVWAQENPDAFVHLGDIYYSGTQEECENNFLNVFTEVASELGKDMVPVFTIPGNHEYYSFGNGFFWLINNMNSGTQKQTASYFCLRTVDNQWQFLAMDTGQDDNNPIVTAIASFAPKLMGDRDDNGEFAWHKDKLKNFPGNTILMSHHQLFSRAASIDGKVTPYFSRYLHGYFSPYFNKIAAWFWGHEHSFAIYQDGIYGLAKGRLLGSSSYEEATSDDPYTNNYPLVPYAPFAQPGNSNGYYDHVCAVLDFSRVQQSDPINVRYYSFPSWGQDDSMPNPANLTNIYNESIGASTMKSQKWTGNNKISDGNIECKNTPSLCTDGSKIYMLFQDPDDNLHFSNFDPELSSVHDSEWGLSTDHSPAIAYDGNGTWYAAFSDKNDSSKLSIRVCQNGSWGTAYHVNDSHGNTIKVGSGISAAWISDSLYVSFVENGTDNVRVVQYTNSAWSYLTLPQSPESNDNGPGLGVSRDSLFLLFADKNNNNLITYLFTDSLGNWYNGGLVCNGVSNSSADMAYPKAHDNISVATEANGSITAFYRGENDSINWLNFDSNKGAWQGGVSLPRIGKDSEPPLTSESAGSVGLSDGVFVCFRGRSTNDIRWARRTDA